MASLPPQGKRTARRALLGVILLALGVNGVWATLRLATRLVAPTPAAEAPAIPLEPSPGAAGARETAPPVADTATATGAGAHAPPDETALPDDASRAGPAGEKAATRPAAPAPQRTEPGFGPDARITLERTVCYGYCPAYTVSITAGGLVRYEGKEFVRVHGVRVFNVDAAGARALFEHARAARFFDLSESYDWQVTDNPTATVTLAAGGRTKKIRDYPPCHEEERATPRELCAIEKEIDALAGTDDLVRCHDDAGRAYCSSP